jgi:hypothetical protein
LSDYTVTTVNGVSHPEIIKDPDAVLDYPLDWAPWLTDIADTLANHTVTADAGLTMDSSSIVGTKVIAWLSGGTEAETYQVVYHIITTGGREDDRSIFVKIAER